MSKPRAVFVPVLLPAHPMVMPRGLDSLRPRWRGGWPWSKSLSDPTRLRIISLLSEREYCVTDLVAALGMEQSTISHQLREMREAVWVRYRREGRHVFYALDDEHVRDLYRQALAHIGQV